MSQDTHFGRWPRRALLGSLVSAGGLLAAAPVLARGVSGPHGRQIAFDIHRGGDSIGRHAVSFRPDGERLEVDIEIDIAVSLAFIPVFSYRHRNHEVWQDGRLIALDSTTDDDGEDFAVTARAVGDRLRVVGSEGEIELPAETLPTSYWDPRTVTQTRLLDTQRGVLLNVEPRLLGDDVLQDGTPARRYQMSGDLDLDLWYSPSGEWLKITFEARGAQVSYARRTAAADDGISG